jgi:hypothetical protein
VEKELKKKLGRPRKKEGVNSFEVFARAGVVMSLYDEAREDHQKHSAAIAQTVELIKQRYPTRRISETGVKRILAAWRPRGSQTIFLFKCSPVSQSELAKRNGIQDQLASSSHKEELKLPGTSDIVLPASVTTYRILVGKRPNYPRHNRKFPKE